MDDKTVAFEQTSLGILVRGAEASYLQVLIIRGSEELTRRRDADLRSCGSVYGCVGPLLVVKSEAPEQIFSESLDRGARASCLQSVNVIVAEDRSRWPAKVLRSPGSMCASIGSLMDDKTEAPKQVSRRSLHRDVLVSSPPSFKVIVAEELSRRFG